jgi:hypothetical protein
MNKITCALSLSLLVIGGVACGKSQSNDTSSSKPVEAAAAPKVTFEPCEAATITKLAADIDQANCVNVDLSDKAITDACEAVKTKITGKRYALKGCTFAGQGNDEVRFGATGTDASVTCVMKGLEEGNKAFRHAAMAFDIEKLRLDVTGVMEMGGDQVKRLRLRDCEISVHE